MTTSISIYAVLIIWFLPCLFFFIQIRRIILYIEKEEQENFYSRKTEGYDKLKEEEEDRHRGRIFSSDVNR